MIGSFLSRTLTTHPYTSSLITFWPPFSEVNPPRACTWNESLLRVAYRGNLFIHRLYWVMEYDKLQYREQAEQLRRLAFFGVVLSTVIRHWAKFG